MGKRSKAIAGALVAALIVNVAGALFFLAPIKAADSAGAPVVPPLVGILIYLTLSVAFLDWLSQQMGHP